MNLPVAEIFFVIGADSWNEIDDLARMGKGFDADEYYRRHAPRIMKSNFSHVTPEIQEKIVVESAKRGKINHEITNYEITNLYHRCRFR